MQEGVEMCNCAITDRSQTDMGMLGGAAGNASKLTRRGGSAGRVCKKRLRAEGRGTCEPSPTSSQPLLARPAEATKRLRRVAYCNAAMQALQCVLQACCWQRPRDPPACASAVSRPAWTAPSPRPHPHRPRQPRSALCTRDCLKGPPSGAPRPVHPLQGLRTLHTDTQHALVAARLPGVFVRHRFPP